MVTSKINRIATFFALMLSVALILPIMGPLAYAAPADEAVAPSEELVDAEVTPVEEYADTVSPEVFDMGELVPYALAGDTPIEIRDELNGTKVESFRVEWKTADTPSDNGDPLLLTQKWTDNEPKIVQGRISFALSGQRDYEVGEVQITIPTYIFEDRNGDPTGRMLLAVPQAPDANALFTYSEIDGNYVITNNKKMVAASSGMIEFSIRDLIPSEIKDQSAGYVTKPFSAFLEVVTEGGDILYNETEDLTAVIDTGVSINGAVKKHHSVVYDVYPASWPQDLKPTNAEDYYYANWSTFAYANGNQYYSVSIEDNSRVDSGDNKNALTLGFKSGDNVISGDGTGSASGQIVDNVYLGEGQKFHTTVYTAYPKADFAEDRLYNLKNSVTFTMTSVDDNQVTSTTANATLPFSPMQVEFPTGHFIVKKNGAGDVTKYVSGKREGIYSARLNQLELGNEVDLTYAVEVVGIGGPWTVRDGGSPENLNDYGDKSYKLQVTDDKLTFHNTDIQIDNESYEFKALEIRKPKVQNFVELTDSNSTTNPYTGTEYSVDAKPLFGYINLPDSEIPDVVVYGKTDVGDWVEYGVVSYSSGNVVIAPKNGASVDGELLVFPENITAYRTEAETKAASVVWNMIPTVTLKPSAYVTDIIAELFESGDMPSAYLANTVHMSAFVNNAQDELKINYDTGRDLLLGFAYGAKPEKKMVSYENDTSNRKVDVTYELSTTVQTNLLSKAEIEDAVNSGLLQNQENASFYDLLPQGFAADSSSIKARPGDKITGIKFIQNYKDTDRTLMIVDVDLSPDYKYQYRPESSILSAPGYYDKPTITYSGAYSWFSMSDFGYELHNDFVYESGNESIGSVKGLTGEPDDPKFGNNSFSQYFTEDPVALEALTNINPDHDNPSFLYASDVKELIVDVYTLTSLLKQVDVNNEGAYGDGLDNLLAKNVYENGEYSYIMTVKNSTIAKSRDLIFYDNLENYVPTDDKPDVGDKQWRGEFRGIDVSPMITVGVDPVIYYSTSTGLVLDDTNDRSDLDLTNSNIWSTQAPADLSTVTALAVDARTAQDGTPFILPQEGSLSAYIHMRAPEVVDIMDEGDVADWFDKELVEGETEAGLTGGAHAYNNVIMTGITISVDTGTESENELIRYDYTKVGLKPYSIDVNKSWDDDNNRDGLRTDSVTVRLYADGVDTGRSVVLNGDNEWSSSFDDILKYSDTGEIIYTLIEDNVEGYSFVPGTPVRSANGELDTYSTVNVHEPERVDVRGEKLWENDVAELTRPDSITVNLVKNGEFFEKQTVKPDADGNWNFAFTNLFKYENGQEIVWTVTEDSYTDGYVKNIDNFTITNTYDPYGNITLTKKVNGGNAEQKALGTEFAVEFFINDKDGEVHLAEYDWTSTDGTSGKASNGTVFFLSEGEVITIEGVDSDLPYRFNEIQVPSGYTFNPGSNMSGKLQAGATNEHEIINDYNSTGNVSFNATKTLEGRDIRTGEFKFELVNDSGEVIRTAMAKTDGSVTFGAIDYTGADSGNTYTYTIREVDLGRGGITYDTHEETVKVNIMDNGDGTLNVMPIYEADGSNFTNVYEASGEVNLKAWKAIKGGFDIADGQFEFEAVDADGNVVATGTANAEGVIDFTPISFNETNVGEVNTYTVREVVGTDENMTYDTTTATYTVEVFDNYDGTLSFNASGVDDYVDDVNNDPNTPLFVNEYKPGDLTIQKKATNGDPNQEFRFKGVLTGPEGSVPTGEFELTRDKIPGVCVGEPVVSGEIGTVTWEICDDGLLLFRPTDGVSGTMESLTMEFYESNQGAWLAHEFTSVYVAPGVKAGTSLSYIMPGVTGLTSGDMSNLDTSAVTDMSQMFYGATLPSDFDINGWDTSAVTRMDEMFSEATLPSGFDINGWDTSAVTSMVSMFSGATLPSGVDINGWDTSAVTDMSQMFYGATLSSGFDISGWDTSAVTSMHFMFMEATLSSGFDISGWDTSAVTRMDNMFIDATLPSGFDISGWDTSAVTDMSQMFSGVRLPSGFDISGWDTSAVTSMYGVFSGATLPSGFDISGWDISAVTHMGGMFSAATLPSDFDISGWDTSPVTSMDRMFYNVTLPSGFDISGWDTSAVTNMGGMFSAATLPSDFDISGWDTSAVGYMGDMFNGVEGLQTLTISDKFIQITANPRDVGFTGLPESVEIIEVPFSQSVSYSGDASFETLGNTTEEVTVQNASYSGVQIMESAFGIQNMNTTAVPDPSGAVVESGTTGTVTWEIHDNGLLLFRPTEGVSGTMESLTERASYTNQKAWLQHSDKFTSVYVAPGVKAGSSLQGMLYNVKDLTSVDMSNLDTSAVTSMSGMFYNTTLPSGFDISGWDTSAVTNMSSMFRDVTLPSSFNINGWDTSAVRNMGSMFDMAILPEGFDISGWDTSAVTNMSQMFYLAKLPEGFDISGWDTSAVMDMGSMFRSATLPSGFDISGWDTSAVTNMSWMFNYATLPSGFDISGWDTSAVRDMRSMFNGVTLPEGFDISGWNTSAVTNMNSMFQNAKLPSDFDISGWDTSAVTNMGSMFQNAKLPSDFDISGWDTSAVTSMRGMFYNVTLPSDFDISGWDTSAVTNMREMFRGATLLSGFDISGWDTSAVTNMYQMFYNATLPSGFGISDWDTSAVIDMVSMFSGAILPDGLDISGWDTSAVRDMRSMFQDVTLPEGFDISDWDTSAVTRMGGMFSKVTLPSGFDISGWDTSAVTDMRQMFYYATFPSGFDISGWDTSDVTTMYGMFSGCTLPSGFDISGWDTSAVTTMSQMFYVVTFPSGFDISGWDTSAVTTMSQMFVFAKLPSIKIGSGFTSLAGTNFPQSSGNMWVKQETGERFTKAEMMALTQPDLTGTFVQQRPTVTFNFDANGGSGSMAPFTGEKHTLTELPESGFGNFGYRFAGWSTSPTGPVMDDLTIISSAQDWGTTTVYAQWTEIDNTINIQNGEFEFTLIPGEQVTLPDVPAGVSYQIYEETAEGWVLVSQTGTDGVIEANAESIATFTNEYNPGATQATISGTKSVVNGNGDASGYTFELYEGANLVGTAVSGYDGTFTFDNIVYTASGTHNYTIKEVAGTDPGMVYDTRSESVEVVVTDNGAGKLSAVVHDLSGDGIGFVNTVETFDLVVEKNVTGGGNATQDFNIRVTIGTNRVEEFTLKAGETKTFVDLPYGTSYKVEEVDIPQGYSLASITNAEGVLTDGNVTATVNNQYQASGSFAISGSKVLEGRELASGEFTFELLDSTKQVVGEASNDGDGNFYFDAMPVTSAGEHIFYVREVAGDDPTITYDTHEETVRVVATDNGAGRLNVTVNADADGVVFNNTYEPPITEGGPNVGSVEISKQVVNSASMQDFTVNFGVTLADGTVPEVAYNWVNSNGEAGTVVNGETLLISGGETITVSDIEAGAKVVISEEEAAGFTLRADAVLEADVVADEVATMSLVNVYDANGSLELAGNKELFGADIADYGFDFLVLHDGDVVNMATNSPDGTINYQPLRYSLSDIGKTYTYQIVEQPGYSKNIKYDDMVHELTVIISDNGDGTLNIETSGADPMALDFHNSYRQELPVTGTMRAVVLLITLMGLLGIGFVFHRKQRV